MSEKNGGNKGKRVNVGGANWHKHSGNRTDFRFNKNMLSSGVKSGK